FSVGVLRGDGVCVGVEVGEGELRLSPGPPVSRTPSPGAAPALSNGEGGPVGPMPAVSAVSTGDAVTIIGLVVTLPGPEFDSPRRCRIRHARQKGQSASCSHGSA